MSKQSVKILYHTADTCGCRRTVCSADARGNYSSFEEAKSHYTLDFEGDSAILANINGE